MNFDFSDEQYMFQTSTREMLESQWAFDRVRALMEGEGFDQPLWETLAEQGTFGMLVPEDHGGLGRDFVDLALIVEELGRALVPSPVLDTLVSTDLLVRYGSEAQKRDLLPTIASGSLRLVPAMIESETGYEPEEIRLTARSTGDGWQVSGRKLLVSQAAGADLLLVALRLNVDGPLTSALLEPSRAGVSITPQTTFDLTSRYFEVSFDKVAISRDDLLDADQQGGAVDRLFDVGATLASLTMVGIAAKVLDDTVAYVKQREQFGQPVGSFQAIKHRAADMAVSIEAARSAAYYAGWAIAQAGVESAKAVSMAKSYCGDMARFVCNEGIQLHGGIGFTWDLGLHLYLRRVKMLEFTYGDASFHRERVMTSTLSELGVAAA